MGAPDVVRTALMAQGAVYSPPAPHPSGAGWYCFGCDSGCFFNALMLDYSLGAIQKLCWPPNGGSSGSGRSVFLDSCWFARIHFPSYCIIYIEQQARRGLG